MLATGRSFVLLFSVGISIFGLFIVPVLVSYPPSPNETFLWRKPILGLLLGLICFFGILAALFPRQCSHSLAFETKNVGEDSGRIKISSHHPDCSAFSAHVVHIGSHTFCAACSGLLVGAIAALVGTSFYVSGLWHPENASLLLALIGVAGTTIGFFQLKFKGFARLVLNVFFVLGAFTILVGVDALTESLFIDLFLLSFTVFWISTRILLSQWDHWKICDRCKSPCEARQERKNWG